MVVVTSVETATALAFLFAFAGVLARVFFPYLRKIWSGEITGFSMKYVVQALAGVVMCLYVTMMVIPGLVLTGLNMTAIIYANFIVGWGSVAVIDELFSWGDAQKKTVTLSTLNISSPPATPQQ